MFVCKHDLNQVCCQLYMHISLYDIHAVRPDGTLPSTVAYQNFLVYQDKICKSTGKELHVCVVLLNLILLMETLKQLCLSMVFRPICEYTHCI